MSPSEINLTPGSKSWKKWRRLATTSVPSKHSSLWFLNEKILRKGDLIPMTRRAHLGMCLFAESATGIPEIDSARVKLILVPRGVGKTSLVTKSLPILRILRDRSASTGIANEIADNAKTFLGDIKAEFESNEVLRALFPETIPENTRDTIWASDRIITKRDKLNPTNPSVLATGVGGTVTGVHLGMWILDDLISQNAAENARRGSFTEIEATNRWVKRLQPLLEAPKRDPILIIGCIEENQPVLMADGTWKPIKNVEVGDEVWARKKDGSEGFKPRKVTGVWPQGYSEVVEIDVAGRQIICTPDHPFLGREKYFPASKPKWKKAKEFVRENGEETRGVLMEIFEGMPGSDTECDYDFAWLAGFMWGDGWVTKYERPDGELNYSVCFARGVHEALNRRVSSLLNKYFGDLGGECYRTGINGRTVRMDNNEAGRRWERWGLTPGVRAPEKTLPKWLFRASKRCKRAFLHGICSADGSKSSPRRWQFGTSSREMAEQIHRLAMTCNVRPSSIYDHSQVRQAPNSPEPKWSQMYTFNLNFLKRDDETKCYGVKSVEELTVERPVYDITVEDGDCTFVVNGAECQNTRWWEQDTYEFVEDFWGHDEPRIEYLWSLPIPPEKHTFDGRTFERDSTTQKIKLYRRGEIAVFKLAAIDDDGRPLFPERYDLEELDTLRREDPAFFAGQYMLEPASGEASVFNEDWLKFYEFDGSKLRYRDRNGKLRYVPVRELTTFISVDPAFSKSKDAARTAIPVVGTDGERLFLLEDFAARLDSEDDIAAKVLDFTMEYRPQRIFVETIVAQVAVANAIRRRFRESGFGEPPLEEIKSHGKKTKVMRIFGLEHYWSRGLFHVHKSQHRFLKEYSGFPRSALRDILDALAFQTDAWERVFSMTHYGQGQSTPEERKAAEAAAVERVRRAWGRRGRRRR